MTRLRKQVPKRRHVSDCQRVDDGEAIVRRNLNQAQVRAIRVLGNKFCIEAQALCFRRCLAELAKLLFVVDMLVLHVLGSLRKARVVAETKNPSKAAIAPEEPASHEMPILLEKQLHGSELHRKLPPGATSPHDAHDRHKPQSRRLTLLLVAT